MSVYLQYVPRAARGGVCSEGAARGASSVTNTTDAPLNAEGKNRKRTLVRPSACFPQRSSLTLFLQAELGLCLCSKHESIPISHSGIWLEYIATPGRATGHVQWRYHC